MFGALRVHIGGEVKVELACTWESVGIVNIMQVFTSLMSLYMYRVGSFVKNYSLKVYVHVMNTHTMFSPRAYYKIHGPFGLSNTHSCACILSLATALGTEVHAASTPVYVRQLPPLPFVWPTLRLDCCSYW